MSTSIVVRLRRRRTEAVHVSVPVTDELTRPEPEADGSYRFDVDRLFAEAVRLGRDEAQAWQDEEPPEVEIHPLQTPPADPSSLSPGAIARRWLACFAAHDLDGLLGLYAEDAVHTSPKIRVRHPETGGVLRGKAALRAWWADAFARLPDLGYALGALTVDGNRAFLEYTRRTAGDPDLPVAEVLDVTNGRIAASRVYHG